MASLWAHLCSTWPSLRSRYGVASPDAVPASAALPTPCESPDSPRVQVTEPPAHLPPVTDGLATTCVSRDLSRGKVTSGIRKRSPRPATSASAAAVRAPRPKKVFGPGKVYTTFCPAESSLAVQAQWERRSSYLTCFFCTATTAVVVCVVVLRLVVILTASER